MAIVVTRLTGSDATSLYKYTVTGLVNGANVIALPVPPLYGSFPPDGSWTPTTIRCWPYQNGAIGALVTPDPATIVQSAGTVTFTVYASGATNAVIEVN